jgi:predicted permease
VFVESIIHDVRYALRGVRRSPLFAISVAATIGLGLGVLCSAFTVVNAYVFRPIDLPEPWSLYELSWDSNSVRRQGFRLADVAAMRTDARLFSGIAASTNALVMQDGQPTAGRLVDGDYFHLLKAQAALGRTLAPFDATTPGGAAVVVLSQDAWRSRYGADPAIVGKRISLGPATFDIVGVMPQGFGLPGEETVAFWAPLTMARAFAVPDPWTDPDADRLTVTGRLRADAGVGEARVWLEEWLRQRFPAGSERAPVAVRVESRATRIPLTRQTTTLFALLVSAFGLVLLVACANVTNLLLARGFGRQREIAVRLSLGGRRSRVVRQLIVESVLLAVPAALIGLGLTYLTARVFPTLIAETFPIGAIRVRAFLVPMEPDVRVLLLLCTAAIAAAVTVAVIPALRVTRANLVRASKGEEALDTRRSRLRGGLVAVQIGACVLFLVGALGLIDESRRLSNPDTRLSYELVSDVRVAPHLRAGTAARLASDPSIERVAAAWEPPLTGELSPVGVVASETRIEQVAGFMVVSPDYFALFDIQVVRGRVFTTQEADENAAVALVSEATARTLWPGLDPIGQTLDLVPSRGRAERRPRHRSVRIIGVTEDVVSGTVMEGLDKTCVYFATGFQEAGGLSLLVRGRASTPAVMESVTAAVNAVEPEAPFRVFSMREMLGGQAWFFSAFSTTASLLGGIGLLLAFSGTYAVVAFLVAQRTREFGIRLAIGATVRQIVAGMVRETLQTAFIGIGAGLAASLALVQAFRSTIPIIPALDVQPYVMGTAIVLIASVIAALLPSLRASRIDPSAALRAE